MGKFIISKRKNNEYQFNLKAANGQVILMGEGYTAKSNCGHGITSVRENATYDSRYERKISANGQVIGTSELYETASGRDNGIASVKENAPHATIEDTTL
jgi:uncharacterized protein YegP (UPF0339 family)